MRTKFWIFVVVFLGIAYIVGEINPNRGESNDTSRQSAVTPTPPPAVKVTCAAPLRAGRLQSDGMFDSGRTSNGRHYRHGALDIFAPTGTPIYAIRDGLVTEAGGSWDPDGWGKIVYLRHAGNTTSLYAHANVVLVRTGQKVKAGQQIATVGHSGNASAKNPHLHLEIGLAGDRRFHRNVTNPVPYLKKCGGWNSRWD